MSSTEGKGEKEHPMSSAYYGWSKTIVRSGEDYTPTKLTSTEIQQQTTEKSQGSAWNKGGTWEEQDKTKWATEFMKSHLLASFDFTDTSSNLRFVASSVKKCEGEAKIILSRGKKRCGYDLVIELDWSGECLKDEAKEKVTGVLKVHEFEDTNAEEYEIEINVNDDTSDDHKLAKFALRKLEPQIRAVFAEFHQELMKQ